MGGDVISLKTTCFSINKKRVTMIGEEKLTKTYTGDAKNKATPFTQLSLLHVHHVPSLGHCTGQLFDYLTFRTSAKLQATSLLYEMKFY